MELSQGGFVGAFRPPYWKFKEALFRGGGGDPGTALPIQPHFLGGKMGLYWGGVKKKTLPPICLW